MRAWNLGTILGIKVRVHWTFLILPVWIYFSSILSGSGAIAALTTIVFVLAIFGCVLLHELGHALAARQFGIATRDITLLPIGGVAALERMPREPWQELWIAVAGPLVNVVIAGILFSGIGLLQITNVGMLGEFIWRLALANVILVVFNLFPAFPMDGGRMLRSVLAMFIDWTRATTIAANLGRVTAIAFGILGLLSGNLVLVFVALFVFFAAQGELMMATSPGRFFPPNRGNSGYGELPAGFEESPGQPHDGSPLPADCNVPASLSTSSVAAWLANRRADHCQVIHRGKPIGTITRGQILVALHRGMGAAPVGSLLGTGGFD